MADQKYASVGTPSSTSGDAGEGGQKAMKRIVMGEKYTSGRKLKSAADSKNVKGVSVQKGVEWKQPLRRHINPETDTLEFVTILVRVLSGDAEHDFHARFPPTPLYAKNVCAAIAEREHLQSEEARIFTLWVISKDLEMQIRPDQDIFELMVFWNRWVMKYTHFPEAEDPRHHINRHWFIYRREANISLRLERELAGEVAVSLLFGEAKRNILTRRYVCSQLESATIAGYQLQMTYGDYLNERSPSGYLIKDDRLNQLLPVGMIEKMRPSKWEEIITVQYKSFLGLNPLECRQGFLEFVRHMPCYGCTFFPVCAELPPSGFFEFRTQNWFLGTGPNGLCIIDSDVQKYVYNFNWKDITFKSGPDQFFIYQQRGEKVKEIKLITPQGKIIDNLALRHKYSWAKENGKLKSKNLTKDAAILESITSFLPQFPGRKKSIALIESVKRKGHGTQDAENHTMRSSIISTNNPSKVAMLANFANKRRESKASFKSDTVQQEIPEDGQSKTTCNPTQSQNQTTRKENQLTAFMEEDEEEKPEQNAEKKFQETSLSKITEVIKASSDHLAESFENLGKMVSKSVSRLIQSSEEQIPQNVEKVKISTEDMNSMFITEVVRRKAPGAKENLKELMEVKVITEPPENIAIPIPRTTSALVKERKKNRRPIFLSKRHGNSFNNSSNTSLEADLLSQLDGIASSVGVVVPKADVSALSKPKISSSLNSLGSPSLPVLPLPTEQHTINIEPSSTNDENNSAKDKPANENELEIKAQNHLSRISKTPSEIKNDLAMSLIHDASPLGPKKQIAGTASPKLSPSSSRPPYLSDKKASKFGRANDLTKNSAKKVRNPSSKPTERLTDSMTPIKLSLPENVEIEVISDSLFPEELAREESNVAPASFTPIASRHSQLPTGHLGTHIDVLKVKQQRQSRMMPSKAGIVKRSDDVFSLDAIIGGVGETELIDKREGGSKK